MAGRRRRVSNSTVATFDDSHVHWVPETAILKPLASNNEDSNDWPCFVLTEAVILHKDGRRPANPLLVHSEGPFIVRGKLELEKEQRHFLKSPVKSAYIEIPASWLYSIGYDPIVLWVSGAAGWFEIVPALQYEPMYHDVREAITLYYVVMDACEAHETYISEYSAATKSRKKLMKPPEPLSLDSLFLKYAIDVGDGIYHHEAEERCHKWAQFLINHFPKESEFDWSGTLFYEWIIGKHPDIQKRRMKAAGLTPATVPSPKPAAKPKNQSPPKSRSQTRNSLAIRQGHDTGDPEVEDDTEGIPSAAIPKPTGRNSVIKSESLAGSQSPGVRAANTTRSSKTNSPPARTPSHPPDDSELVINLLLGLLEETASESANFQRIRRTTVHSKIYSKCKIRDYKTPQDIINYYSSQLLQKLPSKWQKTPFYDELKDAAKQPDKPLETITPDIIPSLLVRRQNRVNTTIASPLPAPPKMDVKAKVRRVSDSSGDESDDGSGKGFKNVRRPGPGRPAGKRAGLRLITLSKKRTASEMDDDSEPRRGKSVKTSHSLTDDEEGVASADDDDDDENETSDAETPAYDDEDPDGLAVPPPEDAVRIVVHAEKIPSMSPMGPNGTWVCNEEDCGFVVRSAEEDAGKALIQQHFRDHESQAEMLDLAVSEGRRGHVPINHLLAKIQALGRNASASERDTLNGDDLAAPIKRRLIV